MMVMYICRQSPICRSNLIFAFTASHLGECVGACLCCWELLRLPLHTLLPKARRPTSVYLYEQAHIGHSTTYPLPWQFASFLLLSYAHLYMNDISGLLG